MLITSLAVKNFRCFATQALQFQAPLVILKGNNGSGKTSLLEALHYSCYFRSFRTRTTRELIHFEHNAFSIKLTVSHKSDESEVLVGYSGNKRIIKVNGATLSSYKDLVGTYRVITITDDDLALIKGSPEGRRTFLDQAIALIDPDYITLIKRHNTIVSQRNALLVRYPLDRESYDLWTQQLVETSQIIRSKRQELISQLNERVGVLINQFFEGSFKLVLEYKPKDNTIASNDQLITQEKRIRHTLIGAHLDDCMILVSDRLSKSYASRGQQKLAAILLKLAQPAAADPQACSFLFDDVFSDLDNKRLERIFALITSYKTQLIIASPLAPAGAQSFLDQLCSPYNPQDICL